MKKVQTFVLSACAALSAFGADAAALDNWRQAVSTNDFKRALAAAKAVPEEWPAVRSVKHAGAGDAESDLPQDGFRDVARVFLLGLEQYEKTFRGMAPEAFCEASDELLDVRGRFLKHPGYANYFLADAINRVIYVNLGERLVLPGDVPACYDRIVERLAGFRFDLPQMVALVNEEYGTNLVSMAEIKKLPLACQLQTVGKAFGQENFFFLPQDMHNTYRLRILEKQSLSALLNRLVISDHIIGASLPALLDYRKKASTFTPFDIYPQVGAVLGKEMRSPPTLWSDFSLAASNVSDLLREIQSEKWRQRLCLSDPPVFTEEFIETLERQEMEREAVNRRKSP